MQSVWKKAKKTTLTYFLVINFKRKYNIYVMYCGYFAYHLVEHPSNCFLESLFSLTASQTLKHVSTVFYFIQYTSCHVLSRVYYIANFHAPRLFLHSCLYIHPLLFPSAHILYFTLFMFLFCTTIHEL